MDKAKILLVDDRPENLIALSSIIEEENREIILANSGNEGLKAARLHDLALILTDVQMPEMDGFEMVELLRMNKKTNKVPVIFVTAISKDQKYVERGYSEGAVDYLFKPLDPIVVQAKVDNFITIYQQRAQLEKQNERLEAMNQEKNKFLGMAAHDIRNPLSVIECYTKELMEEMDHESTRRQYRDLENIYTSTTFIRNLVNEFLDITKIESGNINLEVQETDPGFLLKKSAEFNRLTANKKNIAIKEHFALNGCKILLDSSKIMQVINNLLTNAIKFSNPGTNVSVGGKLEGGMFSFYVEDQGPGIPKVEQEHLFKSFVQTSVKATAGESSTGLGLAIVKKIVEAHGGGIEVESEVGEGAKFEVHIPVKVLEASTAGAETIDNQLFGAGIPVLVVEDDLLVQMMLQRIFNKYGFKVELVGDAETGLEKLESFRPKLIFTDIHLPGMNGYAFAKAVKERGVDTPIYGLTGGVTEEVTANCKAAGMQGVYDKMITKEQLEEVVRFAKINGFK